MLLFRRTVAYILCVDLDPFTAAATSYWHTGLSEAITFNILILISSVNC